MTRSLLRDPNLHIIFAVTLMAVLGVSSIAPALPRIARTLDVSPRSVGYLITVFTLPGVLLTPVLGVLADRWGRKRVLVPALLLFAVAGGGCALAGSFQQLLVLRFVQGMGAAGIGSLNITLIGDLYSGHARSAAMGYNASVLSVGTAGYPALGGFLAQLGWQYPFLLALLAIPVGIAVLHTLQNPEPRQHQTLRRYLGGVWRNVARREVLGLFAVSVMTFVILFGSILTYFPLLLDRSYGASSALIGLIISSSSFATAIASFQIGKLTRRFPARDLILVSFVLYAISVGLVPLMPSWPWLFLPVLLFGAAMGLNLPSLLGLLTGLAPPERRAAFMALNGTVLRLGQTLGPLVMGLLFVLGGMHAPFWGGALLGLVTVPLILATVPRQLGRRTGPDGSDTPS